MVFAIDYFRGHVAWRSAGILVVIGLGQSGHTQVSDAKIAFVVYHQILWLYVSVDDAVVMQIFQPEDHAAGEELDHFLPEVLLLTQVEAQVSPEHEIHDEV